MRRVLVTGASGFVGRHAVAGLMEAGLEVTVLARRGSRLPGTPGLQVVRGDLTDRGALAEALAGRDALVHLAYDIRATAAANLAGFETLRAEARTAGTGRIVHASSIVVYDGWPDGDLDETAPMSRPGGGPYRQAKIAMERALLAGPLPAAILQPTLVWGAGSALWTERLAAALAGGTVVLPDPEGLAELVHVADLAAAIVAAVRRPEPLHERIIVSGPGPVPWSALLEGYARVLGRGRIRHEPLDALRARLGPPPAMAVEDPAPPLAARLSAAARRLVGHDRVDRLAAALRARRRDRDLLPDHHMLELFAASGRVSTAALRDRLGVTPAIDLERGLAMDGAALRQRHGA